MPKASKNRTKPIHPNSRKAAQLSRKEYHNSKLDRKKDDLNIKQQAKLDKLKWFKENLDGKKTVYTALDMLTLMESYLHRFDEEIDKINEAKNMKDRKYNEHMKQEFSMKFLIEKETRDFNSCGLEVPSLMNKKSLEYFSAWDGNSKYLTAIQIVSLSKKKLEALKAKEESKLSALHQIT